MSDDVLKNEKIIEEMLKKKKLIEYIKFPIFFSSTSSSSVYDVTKSILKKDSNIFLKGNKIVLFNDNFKNKNLI